MILVIGGAGFIGSNLCKRLKEDGEDGNTMLIIEGSRETSLN